MQLTDPKSTTVEGTAMPTAQSGEMFADLTTEEAATVNGSHGYRSSYGYGYGYGYRTVSYYRPYRRSYYGGRRGYGYGCY
ncbi:hypothetical protein IQ235_03375 [Oscillatoriales cyanobacterium LEGE 11467]|uniref:Uncharacterized protein n=1 Tax=Zarconia navalis LEGE 11467 TaxID=1828826 RepID=A0A928Z7L9_9CYAN|nr:hypothetical protein [Zarconia navalis]MBE9039833.1 hypothetical protein [Zarconia navalis LEGE 11467]